MWAGQGSIDEVASVSPAGNPTYTRPLDGSAGLAFGTPFVSYRVAVLGPNGELLDLSETLTLELRWSLKPSDAPTPSTTPSTAPAEASGPKKGAADQSKANAAAAKAERAQT